MPELCQEMDARCASQGERRLLHSNGTVTQLVVDSILWSLTAARARISFYLSRVGGVHSRRTETRQQSLQDS